MEWRAFSSTTIVNSGTCRARTSRESVSLAAEVYEARLRSGDVPLTKKQWGNSGLDDPVFCSSTREGPRVTAFCRNGHPSTLTNSNTTAPAAVKSVLRLEESASRHSQKADWPISKTGDSIVSRHEVTHNGCNDYHC